MSNKARLSIAKTFIAAVLLALANTLAPAMAEPIRASVNVDIMPDRLAEGLAALRDYVAEASKDPALEAIELSQRIDAPNHFILDLKVADKARYEAHIQAAYFRKFRERLFPCLGSPWDERLFHDIK
jgi:quinol monooxygenase YgiN